MALYFRRLGWSMKLSSSSSSSGASRGACGSLGDQKMNKGSFLEGRCRMISSTLSAKIWSS
eukprot:CAMPEP_0170623142 /NCGR_PEP_ID=MMETSP0224-20130122/29530_1 /TAXON_ID=285029 /ORGANISM="Togula jolla, Strain CCCM 725" /LENGTH=60 /DNA_ID=CAMNT_0010949555 /DNA_START=770 /DNA_END=952 /DNA_ORIENTATION=+